MEKFITSYDIPEYTENLFELGKPEHYSCQVWKYSVGHSILTIQLRHKEDVSLTPLYAIFETVTYFEGIMWWNGANLKTASHDEYFKLWTKLHKIPENIIVPDHTQGVKLFTFDADNFQIKILAGSISLTDDISTLP